MTPLKRWRVGTKGLAAAVSAALALGGASLAGIPPAAASSTVTLNWITWFGASSVQPVVQAFEKVHPDIHVNIQSFPLNEYIPKVVADMTAKSSAVDILSVDAPEVAEYTTRHYVLPLNKYFTPAELKSSIAAAPLSSSYYQGVLTAPAESSSSHVLYYNPTIFAAHHITPPSPTAPWTWQHIAQVAQQLTVRSAGTTKVWGLVFEQGTAPYEMLPLPESLGANPLNFSSTGWLQAMQYYYNCFNVWKISANLNAPTVTSEADSLFETGHIAMMTGGEWDAVGFAAAKASFNFAPYPKFAGGKWVVPTDGPHLGVDTYSAHVPQAVEFIKYATVGAGPEVQFTLGGELNMPSSTAVLNSIKTSAKFATFPWSIYRLGVNELAYNVPRPVTPLFDAYATLAETLFDNVATGTKPATALASAESQWKSTQAQAGA